MHGHHWHSKILIDQHNNSHPTYASLACLETWFTRDISMYQLIMLYLQDKTVRRALRRLRTMMRQEAMASSKDTYIRAGNAQAANFCAVSFA